MARPEWDLALICEQAGVVPGVLDELFRDRDREPLRRALPVDARIRQHWASILAAAAAAGAVSEMPEPAKPPEERRWRVYSEALTSLLHDVGLVLDVLPEARKRFRSDGAYRIAATIPEKFQELRNFLRAFENTALGFRRMIAQASADLTILVPFMDAEGLSEILPSLEGALERGVGVLFLTRDLAQGGRNLTVLTGLTDQAKRNGWNLRLCEAVLSDDSPISHAKVFSKDGGDELYVGSANLTAASMERTIEIGVFLKGQEARPIAEFLSLVEGLSRQTWP